MSGNTNLSLQDGAKATNPFATDAPAAPAPADNSNTPNILDLFGMQDAPSAASEVGVHATLLLTSAEAVNIGRNGCENIG